MKKCQGHRVTQGECLASLAPKAGMSRDRMWEDDANEQLRNDRDPFLLLPGDRITIPDLDSGEESCHTEIRHRFRLRDEPTKLHIRMLEDSEPRADVPWTLLHNNTSVAEGATSSDGELEAEIDPCWTKLILQFGPEDKLEEYDLQLGALDPIETVSGIQVRLTNLGFDPGPIDGISGKLTRGGVRDFQKEYDLKIDGIVGKNTRGALLDEYGC